MADLISLAEYKAYTGIASTDTSHDATYSAMLPAASQVVRSYTERDFGAPLVTGTRNFQYDGSGYLDIDDATTVTDVSVVIPPTTSMPLQTYEWVAMPPRRDDAPVFYYIMMPGYGVGASPEMGFIRNLDVLAAEGRWMSMPVTVDVTGQWGWPAVPEDVKLATAWIIADWYSRVEGEGLASESIESYARSWSGGAPGQEIYAAPARVRDILAFYAKVHV